MRISAFFNCIFTVFTALTFFSCSCNPVSAADINLQQQILPVRFVYLNKQDKIERIWNNVQSVDQAYVLKFFREDQEISVTADLFRAYSRAVEETARLPQGDYFPGGNNKYDPAHSVSIIQRDSSIEEIHTFSP